MLDVRSNSIVINKMELFWPLQDGREENIISLSFCGIDVASAHAGYITLKYEQLVEAYSKLNPIRIISFHVLMCASRKTLNYVQSGREN
jgi:hypothetical protein